MIHMIYVWYILLAHEIQLGRIIFPRDKVIYVFIWGSRVDL